MMTLSDALNTIDRKQVDGLAMVRSQTGEEYTVIVSGGSKPECRRPPVLCLTEELAVKFWLDAFNEFARDKCGTVYWRTRPQLDSWQIKQVGLPDEFVETVYVVYSRLLISDKPVLAKDDPRVKSYYDDMVEQAVA